jgi:uncharacterized repeat protein (TIGR01451 family)
MGKPVGTGRSAVRSTVRTVIGVAVAGLIAIGPAMITTGPVEATVPGTPGVPQSSSPIYAEDFQNRPGATPIVRLTGYTGATGQRYTAAPGWLQACNGWIASAAQPVNAAAQVTDCGESQGSWNQSQRLAQAIGMYHGQTAVQAQSNFAQTAYTAAPAPGAGLVEFQTATNIPFVATNRFVNFSVDVAAMNCATASAPLLQFSLLNSAGAATNVGSVIDGCSSTATFSPPALGVATNTTATSVRVGTYTSNGAILFSGSSVGVRMVNNNGAASGNDHTFDNIRILDVTPQLDKSFSPTTRITGQTSTLTLTITNTSELAAKNGWSFTDTLPTGLRVAGAASTTCPSPTLTAPVGGGSVALTANLSAGMASCTVTVPVTSTTAGTYTNGPSNITSAGLNPPAAASVTFAAPAPAISLVKSAQPAGITDYVVGQTVNYSFLVTNTGNVPLANVTVTEGAFTGTGAMSAVTCPSAAASVAVGAQVTCTASYVVTQADFDAGSLTNSATATGTPTAGSPPTSGPSRVTIPSDGLEPAISLVKTASPTTVAAPGDTVAYSFLVTNEGNTTLRDVALSDDDFTGDGELSAIVCPASATALAPQASLVCTASYTVTQADVDAGSITNTATASGTPPVGPDAVSDPSTAEVTAVVDPALSLTKSVTPTWITRAGESVEYSFVVMNTGNVTLSDAVITETAFSGTGPVPVASCPAGAASLAPGASVTCTAGYTATQADVDARIISNTAVADASQPDGTGVSSGPSSADVSVFVITLPLTGGTSTEQLLLVGGAAVLVAIILAILHHLHHASHSTRQKRTSS